MKINLRETILVVLIGVSFFLVWHQGKQIKDISRNNTRITLAQCRRSREFGIPVSRFYAKYHVLTQTQLRDYIMTIPTHC